MHTSWENLRIAHRRHHLQSLISNLSSLITHLPVYRFQSASPSYTSFRRIAVFTNMSTEFCNNNSSNSTHRNSRNKRIGTRLQGNKCSTLFLLIFFLACSCTRYTYSLSLQSTSMKSPFSMDMEGPVIVTGGSRGIGKATCLLLASRGCNVVINCRSDSSVEGAKKVRDAIDNDRTQNKEVGIAVVIQADVSNEQDVKRMFDETQEHFGMPPTGLVNNAGILGKVTQDMGQLSKQDLDEVFATNVYGPFYCCREFIQRTSIRNGSSSGSTNGDARSGKGGAIVNVSSGSAYIGNPLVYAMSKGALDSMMAGLAQNLPLEDGIRINAVAPGMTATEMISQEQLDRAIPNIPMKRAGKPSEIAETIYFLLSDASSYCSGAKIRAAGGRP